MHILMEIHDCFIMPLHGIIYTMLLCSDDTFTHACRHPEAASRPTFFDTLLALQRPDFQVLKWTCEEVAAYSKEARTIGSPIEAGQELYTDIQHVYVSQNQ